jgi:hypothetical protein
MIININKIIEIWKNALYFIYFMKYRESIIINVNNTKRVI